MRNYIKNAVKETAPLWFLHSPKYFGVNSSRLKGFRNAYSGKTCVIIGNGPSLNYVNFSLLEKTYTFGVNGIFYKTDETGFRPTFYTVEDGAVMRDNLDRIKNYNPKIASLFPSIYRKFLGNSGERNFFRMDRRFYEERSYNFEVPQFSKDISNKIYCNQSVTFVNFQIAYYMGFSKILLVGMDHNYTIPEDHIQNENKILSTTDDPNHFHPEYFGKGKTWHDPKLHNVELSYRVYSEIFKHQKIQVFNCTHGGNLNVFERSTLEEQL